MKQQEKTNKFGLSKSGCNPTPADAGCGVFYLNEATTYGMIVSAEGRISLWLKHKLYGRIYPEEQSDEGSHEEDNVSY